MNHKPKFSIPAPNYTQLPNVFCDEWLKHLSLSETKVLIVIMRKTFGWHKIRDKISLTQLENYTGCDRKTVIKAGNSLVEKGLILKEVVGRKGEQETYYELIVQDSNNFYQWNSSPPPSGISPPGLEETPSGNFPPTKESFFKEKERKPSEENLPQAKSPMIPRGDFISKKRKKLKEDYEEVAPRVLLTKSQQEDFFKRADSNPELVKIAYDKLSSWKIKENIIGGSDYGCLKNWPLEAARKQILKPNPEKICERNIKFAQKVKETFKNNKDINVEKNCIEFNLGYEMKVIPYKENGFEDQVLNQLKKMNLPTGELC